MISSGIELVKASILVVDDAPLNLELIDDLLSDTYTVKVAPNAARGISLAQSNPQPDLILMDVMMPEMDGYEACRLLKEDPRTSHIPLIFLTAMTDTADEKRGLDLLAVDYITKPINPAILRARVNTHLNLKAASDFLRDRNEYLESEVARRTEEARRRAEEARTANEVMMVALASIAETRDNETGNHILRTQQYVKALALHMQTHLRFAEHISDEKIALYFQAAPLHDIGKVGIPDRILLKPDKLTPEEFEVMKTHTTLGHNAIAIAMSRVGKDVSVLRVACEIALSHQEKWDGSGYPQGLRGEAIPLSARLMALADVYDALISRRVYKDPMTHDEAKALIVAGKGTHFDPDLVEGFLAIENQFVEIAERFKD